MADDRRKAQSNEERLTATGPAQPGNPGCPAFSNLWEIGLMMVERASVIFHEPLTIARFESRERLPEEIFVTVLPCLKKFVD